MIDTHCHLNHPDYYGDLAEVLRRAEESGVERVICVGYDLESSALAIRLAREIRMISATVGIHPNDAAIMDEGVREQLLRMTDDREHVIAIGETGLDYFRSQCPKEVQQHAFRVHIQMASVLNLPLIVHSREAQDDVLSILEDEGLPSAGAVMHCLPADADFARRSIDLGCYVGIDGPVTFKNGDSLRAIVKDLPLHRILLETDSPYLTPHPYRGQRNEPGYLPLIAAGVADAQGVDEGEVAVQTTSNARRFFRLGA